MASRSKEFEDWYSEKSKDYQELINKVLDVLSSEIPKTIPYEKTSRVKSMDSAMKKSIKMVHDENDRYVLKYNDFKTEITDYAGVRIIVYVTSDIEKVCHIIEKVFELDEENCVDKADILPSNQVGYLAKHYIVKLKLADYTHMRKLKDLKCEIQVKTILQNAWAQIFHDRQYKSFKPFDEYPKELIRKTNLVAGVLEFVDSNISELVVEYDKNAKSPLDDIEMWDLLQEHISETSLRQFAYKMLGNDSLPFVRPQVVVDILNKMGFEIIEDINTVISFELLRAIKETFKFYLLNVDKFYMYLLICQNANRFFEVSNCSEISESSYNLLKGFVSNLDELIERFNIKRV